MKSLTKLDWILAGFMTTHYALELLEHNPRNPTATRCFKYFTFPALAKAHGQLREMIAMDGTGSFQRETHTVDTQLVSVNGEFAVVEVRGCLSVKRANESNLSDLIFTSIFRMRLTCHCRAIAEDISFTNVAPQFGGKPLTFSEALPALRRVMQQCAAPFQLRITDFDYETMY